MNCKKKSYKIPSKAFSDSLHEKLTDEMVNHQIKGADKKTYLISFSHYKTKNCEIENLERSSFKKIIVWIKEIGLAVSEDEVMQRSFKIKPINNNNHYSELFSGLSEDAEIKEVVLSGSNRLFYYIDEANKIANCILIKNSHFEYKKKKR